MILIRKSKKGHSTARLALQQDAAATPAPSTTGGVAEGKTAHFSPRVPVQFRDSCFTALVLATCVFMGCAAGKTWPDGTAGSEGGAEPWGTGGGGAGAAGSGNGSGQGVGGFSPTGGGTEGEVYAHDATTLYLLAPISKKVTTVGAFDCIGPKDPNEKNGYDAMHDIAIDKDGNMVGAGLDPDGNQTLFTIDKTTAKCTAFAQTVLDLRGLTFIPDGVLDPGEVLVGLSVDGELVRIDMGTGNTVSLGLLDGVGDIVAKGGDIVSIKNDKTYTSAYLSSDCCNDHILAVNPQTATVSQDLGNTGQIKTGGGLGYWGGTLYAFSFSGRLFAINTANAEVTEIAIQNPPDSFRGAAVTTLAPLELPK